MIRIAGCAPHPEEIIGRVHQEIAKGFDASDTRARLERDGNDVVTSTPEEVRRLLPGADGEVGKSDQGREYPSG
jgi:hypothetical protein